MWRVAATEVQRRREGRRHYSDLSGRGIHPRHSTAALRSSFTRYFESQGHLVQPSSNLVPKNDPSLLFTTAGMVQFKDYFLGVREPPHKAMATVQKCVRAGGKHNDLDNVGYTARHQTFFEMLGNFSFGSYWKREAIGYAWEFLTKEIQLPRERLSVTVLHGDEETADIWRKEFGMTGSKLRYCGPEDNFWSMGDGRGPCGPCTEIFWDQGQEIDGERHLEIWNLVFMQYEKNEDGTQLNPLPLKCIDTGMGLERLASVVQGVPSNWDTDILASLCSVTFDELSRKSIGVVTRDAESQVAVRVIVDHLRAACFLIAEGLTPGPTHRSYILRRILRRAIRYAHRMGIRAPFMASIVPAVVDLMGSTYPELMNAKEHIQRVLTQEETLFFATISNAMDVLRHEFASEQSSKQISGDVAWKLYFHFGFPIDLTEIVAKEQGWTVDTAGFSANLEKTRQQSRETWKGSGDSAYPLSVRSWSVKPKFVGYDKTKVEVSTVMACDPDPNGADVWISIDPCPFYAEGGGQVGDKGLISITGQPQPFLVLDTQAPYPGAYALKVKVPSTTSQEEFMSLLEQGTPVSAEVDVTSRLAIRRNHTATHLLHAALRSVLGDHVKQAGSRVDESRLRFDFTHTGPLSESELVLVEKFINDAIQRSFPLVTEVMDYKSAITQKNAIGLFGDKYESMENVRVVEVPNVSTELCGGTHVSDTSQILVFKIVSQQAVGAGTRRIEALTGPAAIELLQTRARIAQSTAAVLKTEQLDQLPAKVRELLDKQKALEKQLRELQTNALGSIGSSQASISTSHGKWKDRDFQVHLFAISGDLQVIRQKADQYRDASPNAIHVVVCGDRIILSCGSTHSGKLLQDLSAELGKNVCKGGGGETVAEGKLFVDPKVFLGKLRDSGILS